MTKINVATSAKLDEICALLESQKDVTYKYICNISVCEVTYEVEDHGNHGDLIRYTKALIRSLPFGKVIMTRVLYDGQVFDGGKIHKPGEKEYDAFHAHITYRNERKTA